MSKWCSVGQSCFFALFFLHKIGYNTKNSFVKWTKSFFRLIKFIYSEKVTKFCQISTWLLTGTTYRTKVRWRYRKILWLSQNIWTLIVIITWQVFITTAILEIKSAACCRTFADLLFNLHKIVPQICGKYGFTRLPRELTMVPNPFNITTSSVVWKGNKNCLKSWNWALCPVWKAENKYKI